MAGYLKKYVGTYRVLAEYDLETFDFVRAPDGKIDTSFDDYYIPCKNNSKIIHHHGKILMAYIPKIATGRNVIRKIYQKTTGRKLEENSSVSINAIYQKLESMGVIMDIVELDSEILFKFKNDLLPIIAETMGAKTKGAYIKPLSIRNLPRESYIIPKEDMDLYKEAISNFQNKSPLNISYITKKFLKKVGDNKGSNYDVQYEQRKSKLKNKQFIHSIGKWRDYIDFLNQEKI